MKICRTIRKSRTHVALIIKIKYFIKTFIIRPWIKNKMAIEAYKKCGFIILNDFNASEYYGENFEEWGTGDYGEETVNMVLKIN